MAPSFTPLTLDCERVRLITFSLYKHDPAWQLACYPLKIKPLSSETCGVPVRGAGKANRPITTQNRNKSFLSHVYSDCLPAEHVL